LGPEAKYNLPVIFIPIRIFGGKMNRRKFLLLTAFQQNYSLIQKKNKDSKKKTRTRAHAHKVLREVHETLGKRSKRLFDARNVLQTICQTPLWS
jgi:hypothetical protein